MSDNQKIDQALLGDSPASLELRPKVSGVRRINKKGLLIASAALGVVAMVVSGTFNEAGEGAKELAQDAVDSQNRASARPAEVSPNARWYANVPDKVAAAENNASAMAGPEPSPVAPGGVVTVALPGGPSGTAPPAARPNVPPGQVVPNLAGQGVELSQAAIQPRTAAPALAGAGAGQIPAGMPPPPPSPAEQAEQQRQQQAAMKASQDAEQAGKASISVQGFGEPAKAGPPAMGGDLASRLASLQQQPPAPVGGFGMPGQREDDPNKQARKEQFLAAARTAQDPNYLASAKTKPLSPFEVKASTVIPAVLISGINSDLPGQVIAQVRENVYDSKTGNHVLIPQGTRLVGLYDAQVAYGQQRLLLAWNRLIFSDGTSFDLKGMPGADKAGFAGFADQIDNHYAKVFGSALLVSLISSGVQLSQPNNGGNNNNNNAPTVSQTVSAALGQQIGQTAMTITQKNINIQPTLEIRPGYQFNVMVTADVVLPPLAAGR